MTQEELGIKCIQLRSNLGVLKENFDKMKKNCCKTNQKKTSKNREFFKKHIKHIAKYD